MAIYILTGSDTLSRSEFVRSQKANCDPNWLAMNVHHYNTQELADAVLQFNTPAWYDRSLIIVEGKTIGKDDLATISPINRTSNNILLLNLDSLDGRLAVTKYLKQIGEYKQLDLPNQWEKDRLIQQVNTRSRALGINLPTPVARYIADAVGNDLGRMLPGVGKTSSLSGRGYAYFIRLQAINPQSHSRCF